MTKPRQFHNGSNKPEGSGYREAEGVGEAEVTGIGGEGGEG